MVVDEVEAVFEFGIDFFDLRVEHRRMLHGRTDRRRINGRRVELVRILLLALTPEGAKRSSCATRGGGARAERRRSASFREARFKVDAG